jgi:LEA14-like dessication related protein
MTAPARPCVEVKPAMSHNASAPRLALLAAVALSTGCEELQPFLPTVRFDTMEVNDIDFERIDADFVFAVNNPNPIDIGLSSFDYNLGFEGVQLVEGNDDDGFQLKAVGDSELRLPVGLVWKSVWDTFQATRGLDYVGFGLDGNFGFNTPIGEITLPYQESGAFPALRTPKFSFAKVRVGRVDWSNFTARVNVDVNVLNEHASTLFFNNFDYKLKLGGVRVASGLLPDIGEVAGAEQGTLSIPIDVDLVNTGTTVWSALTGGGNLAVGLDANTDVDTPFGILPLHVDEAGNVDVQGE